MDILNAKNIENPKVSILESMVETYLNNVKNVPKTNCSTQTEHADAIFNLEQRLNTVDNKYREKVQEINTPAHEIEERLQRYLFINYFACLIDCLFERFFTML